MVIFCEGCRETGSWTGTPKQEPQPPAPLPEPQAGQPLQASVYPSSSSSMKPLSSLSRMWNIFFTSSGLFFFSPTIWKNFLWSKESTAVGGWREEVKMRTDKGPGEGWENVGVTAL